MNQIVGNLTFAPNEPPGWRFTHPFEQWQGIQMQPQQIQYGGMPSPCSHCYCLTAPASTVRIVPHGKCCKCGDERVVAGSIAF